MSVILKMYKEVKDRNEKRDALLVNITDLSCDLCSAVLWMDATDHLDLVDRLEADIKRYRGLLEKASTFLQEYSNQTTLTHLAARNELGTKFSSLTQELESFGARFRTNRLVDLAINQRVDSSTLNKIHDTVLEAKLEKWLQSPDMKQKQLKTLQLRKDGTGLWLLEGDMLRSWQDNPGSLWITGRLINKLGNDTQLFQAMTNRPPPAIAFFYFDFRNEDGQAMHSALRRIVLQLSAQSPRPYIALEKQYTSKSNGQMLPTDQDLLNILEELLLEIGRTYIVLDALDECKEHDHPGLVDFISGLHNWSKTPLHLLVTSQPRQIFTAGLGTYQSNSHVPRSRFRLAACLTVEISHCEWEDKLDKTLDDLPNDLFGIYDRFLHGIRLDSFVYAVGALRWIMFSYNHLNLDNLADTIAFDLADPKQYIYKPNRREGNQTLLPKWFEGLAVFNQVYVTLAHASVQDYLLSTQFEDRFGCNLSPSHSHTFIAQTCIAYLLHFSDNAPEEVSDSSLDNTSRSYPLAKYAAINWCQYGSALEAASTFSRTEIVHLLLENGADVNAPGGAYGSALQAASAWGHTDIVHLLLENGADINTAGGYYGSALQAGSVSGEMEIVRLLLEKGADVNTMGGEYGSALQAASKWGHMDVV
ncbi:hypothetical protein B0H17DRAFT_983179, partial [Mycena rosella]